MMTNQSYYVDEIKKLVNNIDDVSLVNVACQSISTGIINNQWTLLDTVESLKDLLASTDKVKHIHGIRILADIIKFLQPDYLVAREVEYITEFFCAQIKQHHSFISSSLGGLASLVENPLLSIISLHQVTSTLFDNIIWQTQTVTDRMTFYKILQYVVFNRLEDFRATSSELLFNIISSIDGERDPRNLLIIFSFLPKLYNSAPLGSLEEDAFAIISCYFPIDFHSQASEAGSVTREDLVSALNPCLLAHPDFAPLCLPLILEKIESSLKTAKIDAYNLLAEAAVVWPDRVGALFAEGLWQAARSDVLPPREPDTASAAVAALHAAAKASHEPHLSLGLISIMASCEPFLSDVQLSMFDPSFRLLLSLMKCKLNACLCISQKLLSKLISLLKVTNGPQCDLILDKLASFVKVCLQMDHNFSFGRDLWREVVRVACTETSAQAYSVLQLGIAHIDLEWRLKLYQNIVAHIVSPHSLRSAIVKFLQSVAMVHEDEVDDQVLKKISLQDKEEDLTQAQKKVKIFFSLGLVEKFYSTVDCLFDHLVRQGEPYLSLAISCLRHLLETDDGKANEKMLWFLFSKSSIISTLIKLEVEGEVLITSATVVRILVSSQEPGEQARCVPPYIKIALQHKHQIQKMMFLEALVSPLWPQVTVLTLEDIKTNIIPVALNSFENEYSHTSALQLLASIVNKSNNDDILEIISQSMPRCAAKKEPAVCAYVTKGLVIRSHAAMNLWLDKLVELLNNEDEEIAQAAAEGFHLIMSESDSCLNPQSSHCIFKLLYRQHLFHIVLPKLVQSQAKLQHLKALAYLLQAVPHVVYISHIKEILPLLIKSLDLDCESLLLTVLTTLAHLLSASDCFLQDHVDTFIPRFIHLAKHSLFMHVRIAALKSLCSCLRFPPILLLPHKQKVVAELVSCLDDKKRLVRREAAHTRSKWCLFGAPTPD